VYHLKELKLYQNTYKSKHEVDFFGYGAERGLFSFSCGIPQPNCSEVPGPETNSLFPRGVSYMGGSRWANCFLQGADCIQLKSGVGTPEMLPLNGYQIILQSGAIGKKFLFTSIKRTFKK
jgi:hypothetical protein